MDEPHAVRWAQKYNHPLKYIQWTRWHWTTDSNFTLCGHIIVLGACDECPLFPETSELEEQVNCFFCKRRLTNQINLN